MPFFADSPEYMKRTQTPYRPTQVRSHPSELCCVLTSGQVTLSELHSVVPRHLWHKSTIKGLSYVARDIACAFLVYRLGWKIEPSVNYALEQLGVPSYLGLVLKWSLWGLYWHLQGVILAGWWCLAHEAGHGTISRHTWINHCVGFILHTVSISDVFDLVID